MPKKKEPATTGEELTVLSDKQYEDFLAVFSNEWGRRAPSAPEIKISYNDDKTKSHYIIKKGEAVEDLGTEIDIVILKCRNQYSLYAEDKNEAMRTDEFDNFKQDVVLRKGGEVVMCKPYQEVKSYIKTTAPDMKFINILYVMYKDVVHKIYVKPASRQNLWDYQANTNAKASFSFTTRIGTTTGKKGSTTFYPMTFEKVSDMEPLEFRKMMMIRIELDKTLKMLADSEARVEPQTGPLDNDKEYFDSLIEQ